MKYVVGLIIILLGGTGYYIYSRPAETVTLVPYATWCNGEVEYFTPSETECVSMSKDGVRIATTSITTGLKYFGDTASTSFRELSDVVEGLNKVVSIESVTILPNGEYRIGSTVGNILVKREQFDTIVGNIMLFLDAQKGKKFEYIDARHGSSIFFKYNEK